MDNERDSLGAFHMRIAAFDAGWVNATAEQEAPPTKDGGIDPKGWCAVRTLHNVHRTYSIQSVDRNPDGCACVTVFIVGARRGFLSQQFGCQ